MNKTNLAYHFKDYEEIPKELHNEITSIRKYMEDL